MCVFPTAALHPAFIPAIGATGQHGWGGRPHHPSYLPYFRTVKQQSSPIRLPAGTRGIASASQPHSWFIPVCVGKLRQ